MKHITLLFFLLTTLLVSNEAQRDETTNRNSGTIIYEDTVKFELKLEGVSEQIANSIPKSRSNKKVLIFNKEVSLYDDLQDENTDMNEVVDDQASGISLTIYNSTNKTYSDLMNKKQIIYREFMSRFFIIESDQKRYDFRISGKQKEILGYGCMEALLETEKGTQSIWFTPEIPVSVGPDGLNGLPGLVMEVTSSDGNRHIIATSVDFSEPEADKFSLPKKGKKVSQEEFDAILAEKTEGQSMGGEEKVMIIKIGN